MMRRFPLKIFKKLYLVGDVIGIQSYIHKNEVDYEVRSKKAKLYKINHIFIQLLERFWIYFFEYYSI